MICKKCESPRVLSASGKCSDRFGCDLGNVSHDGYVPEDMGIGGGDYLAIDFCLNCGQVQGDFPFPETEMELNNPDCFKE